MSSKNTSKSSDQVGSLRKDSSGRSLEEKRDLQKDNDENRAKLQQELELQQQQQQQAEAIKRQQEEEERENAELAQWVSNEDNEEDILDAFTKAQEREEQLMKEKRELRRKRLLQRSQEEKNKLDTNEMKNRKRAKMDIEKEENKGSVVPLKLEATTPAPAPPPAPPTQVEQEEVTDGTDSFDMFSSSLSPPSQPTKPTTTNTTTAAAPNDDLDDTEGYYKTTIGEVISFPINDTGKSISFKVLGIIGKGVFSTVLKCLLVQEGEGSSKDENGEGQKVVAMKLIRNNDTMAKAALKEVRILRLLGSIPKGSNQRKKKHGVGPMEAYRKWDFYIVKLLELHQLGPGGSGEESNTNTTQQPPLEYRSHTTLLFEHMPMNLRETLSKFGKNVGINLKAIRSYAKQLLIALQHLARHRIVHADIKPDNILVSANFQSVKLCDFGSAFFETDPDNDPTPYLVSRFYRAPEIIMGLEYDRSVDLWSIAVSLAELYTGNVLFPGRSNNDMLKRFMETIGPFSNKIWSYLELFY